jgi:hypothetical protein
MELHNKILKAQHFIESLSADEKTALMRICRDIQCAQDALNNGARSFFDACIGSCQGICCRNINVNDVVTQLDMIYVLSMKKKMAGQVTQCVGSESLFTADCLFLENGIGPCIFPSNVKPERCIITFCDETLPIKREIKAVRSKFSKLSRFSKIKRPFLWMRF